MMAREKATAKQTKGVRVTMHEVAAAAGVLTATKDYVPAGLALDCVMVDNRAAMYKATAHLIALGLPCVWPDRRPPALHHGARARGRFSRRAP